MICRTVVNFQGSWATFTATYSNSTMWKMATYTGQNWLSLSQDSQRASESIWCLCVWGPLLPASNVSPKCTRRHAWATQCAFLMNTQGIYIILGWPNKTAKDAKLRIRQIDNVSGGEGRRYSRLYFHIKVQLWAKQKPSGQNQISKFLFDILKATVTWRSGLQPSQFLQQGPLLGFDIMAAPIAAGFLDSEAQGQWGVPEESTSKVKYLVPRAGNYHPHRGNYQRVYTTGWAIKE